MAEEIQEPIFLQVEEEDTSLERLDRFLVEKLPEFTRSRLQNLIRGGFVQVNGKMVKPKYTIQEADQIIVEIPPPEPSEVAAEEIPLDVLFEDEHLIVINKSAGMVVHPGAGVSRGTLVNALLAHCKGELSGIGGIERPGIVHRLDKDTSGCLVAAKSDSAHRALSEAFSTRQIRKEYVCVVTGRLSQLSGQIENFIGRNPGNRQKMAIVDERHGRLGKTDFEVFATGNDFTVVRCRIHTGRTHQIRVHMAYSLGHAILGDPIYGKGTLSRDDASRLMLHAWKLGIRHPETGEEFNFEAPLPPEFSGALGDAAQPDNNSSK